MQKFSNNTAIVACVGAGGVTISFAKTNKTVLDFCLSSLPPQPVIIEGAEIEMVWSLIQTALVTKHKHHLQERTVKAVLSE